MRSAYPGVRFGLDPLPLTSTSNVAGEAATIVPVKNPPPSTQDLIDGQMHGQYDITAGARRERLPPLPDRARQLAAIVDGYGLPARQRRGFLDQIIEFVICDTAWEADDAAITPETTAHPIALWAMAWRARSAAWMIRHRRTLETALAKGAS
jgi:hypothetical protein